MGMIFEVLAENNSVEELNRSGCGITASGSKAVAAALEKNKALMSLDITDNRLGDTGAQAIASALEFYDGALEDLVITDHPAAVGTAGREALIAAAKANIATGLRVWTSSREKLRKDWSTLDEDRTEL